MPGKHVVKQPYSYLKNVALYLCPRSGFKVSAAMFPTKKSVGSRMVELYQSTGAGSRPFNKRVRTDPSPPSFLILPFVLISLKRLQGGVVAFVVIFKKAGTGIMVVVSCSQKQSIGTPSAKARGQSMVLVEGFQNLTDLVQKSDFGPP